jgi:catechol 2,3-dioxygenase-like lactoylglutathione lyase family enzyme
MGVRTIGCHHMAFVTNNMEETVRFYHGLLGFPVVVTLQLPDPDPFPGAVPGNLGGHRHYFFRISDRDTIGRPPPRKDLADARDSASGDCGRRHRRARRGDRPAPGRRSRAGVRTGPALRAGRSRPPTGFLRDDNPGTATLPVEEVYRYDPWTVDLPGR